MTMTYFTRTDPNRNVNRFYVVQVTPTLFDEWVVVREWGRRGSPGTVRLDQTTEAGAPIYENLVIGNFLYALGLKIGARRNEYLTPGLAVHLTQQTPLDIVLGDVLLVGPRAVALLEFKRAANWEGR